MFLKKYQFSLEKLLKRKFFKKFENFKRKNLEFKQFYERLNFFQICVFCFETPFRI